MRLSYRFAPHVSALLALALVPVTRNSWLGHYTDDCRKPCILNPESNPTPDPRDDKFIRDTYAAFEWQGGALPSAEPDVVLRYSVIRSFDAKKLYHRPERGLVGIAAEGRSVQQISGAGETLPVHRLQFEDRDPSRTAAYLLAYHCRPVSNPYLAQLAAVPRQLASGTMPMTLFFVSGTGPKTSITRMRQQSEEWLLAAWKQHRASCGE